jgi:hypothetical protein
MAVAPCSIACLIANKVLEGASFAPPWWAKAITRRSSHGLSAITGVYQLNAPDVRHGGSLGWP